MSDADAFARGAAAAYRLAADTIRREIDIAERDTGRLSAAGLSVREQLHLVKRLAPILSKFEELAK